MAYFPMFVDMTERECLIVGGGNVAYRKVIVMLDFGAKVTVVAEDICDELRKLTIDDIAREDKTGSYTANKENNQTDSDAADRITFIKRRFERKDCDGMEMVIAATDDNALNHEIAEYCKANGIMVNAVDQKGISHIISHFQYLLSLISMRQNTDILFLFHAHDFLLNFRNCHLLYSPFFCSHGRSGARKPAAFSCSPIRSRRSSLAASTR